MKTSALYKKLNLTEKSFEGIKKSVAEAEAKTTGEIAVAITSESAHYAFWELLAACGFAAIVEIILILFSSQIQAIYHEIYWDYGPNWVMPMFYVVSAFASILVAYYLANIPALDRLVIPASVRRSCVTHRAFRYFTESGVYETAEHSGILIFVSFLERQVRIVADSGISKKISQDMWNLIADELAENLKKGHGEAAFTTAIAKCGDLLAHNFPAHEENSNELADGLVVLEDSEWF